MVGRGVCPDTARCRSRSIHSADILGSTTKGPGTVDNHVKGERVVGTASGGGHSGQFCLDDFSNEMELNLVTVRGREDGRRLLTEEVDPLKRTTSLKATWRGVRRSCTAATGFCYSRSCSSCAMNCLPTSFNQG